MHHPGTFFGRSRRLHLLCTMAVLLLVSSLHFVVELLRSILFVGVHAAHTLTLSADHEAAHTPRTPTHAEAGRYLDKDVIRVSPWDECDISDASGSSRHGLSSEPLSESSEYVPAHTCVQAPPCLLQIARGVPRSSMTHATALSKVQVWPICSSYSHRLQAASQMGAKVGRGCSPRARGARAWLVAALHRRPRF